MSFAHQGPSIQTYQEILSPSFLMNVMNAYKRYFHGGNVEAKKVKCNLYRICNSSSKHSESFNKRRLHSKKHKENKNIGQEFLHTVDIRKHTKYENRVRLKNKHCIPHLKHLIESKLLNEKAKNRFVRFI